MTSQESTYTEKILLEVNEHMEIQDKERKHLQKRI